MYVGLHEHSLFFTVKTNEAINVSLSLSLTFSFSLLTVRHCFHLHGFGDLLIAGPPCAPPAHLGLEQRVYHS